jgi:hypothetical protein
MVPVKFIIKEGDRSLTSHSGLALMGDLINRVLPASLREKF